MVLGWRAFAASALGMMPLGMMPLGMMPLGMMPLGMMPLGMMPLGMMPFGFSTAPTASDTFSSSPTSPSSRGAQPMASGAKASRTTIDDLRNDMDGTSIGCARSHAARTSMFTNQCMLLQSPRPCSNEMRGARI